MTQECRRWNPIRFSVSLHFTDAISINPSFVKWFTSSFLQQPQALSSNTPPVFVSFFFSFSFFFFSTIYKVTLKRSPRTKTFCFHLRMCAQHSLVCIALIRKSLVLIPFRKRKFSWCLCVQKTVENLTENYETARMVIFCLE